MGAHSIVDWTLVFVRGGLPMLQLGRTPLVTCVDSLRYIDR